MAKVSIIMPAYNAEKTIAQSIESIQAQTYENWELLISDDKSQDKTKEIIQHFMSSDNRIKYFYNSNPSGAWSARNNSLRKVTGKYVAFLDSDDLWLPKKLEMQIAAMKESGKAASHTAYFRVDSQNRELGLKSVARTVSYQDMLRKNHIGNLTGIYDVDQVDIVFQQAIGHEDYDMWLKILMKTDSVGILEPMARYRVHAGGLSANKMQAALWHYKILRSQPQVGFFRSLYLFICYFVSAVKVRI
ncbi:glycosyltransferase family 2 protein [Pseudoalteromonas rubra]|uniref:Glycosyltransferase 2-like domain-containing protein n=1 Tax=Pseudoalteromonas rubra TaxID=43658 RepID=A0A0U3I048_9GAMM|nr:glycosyltransferase family 2 protein [Pseudoalteromonas rubra]ALU43238.1 hypothetical protein AT705_09965 [Pseudoalteromonas rubra]